MTKLEQLAQQQPICIFDTETTGTDVTKDRIIELSILKIDTNLTPKLHTARYNPGVPIPKEASEVHGIYDEDVADKPSFKDKAQKVYEYIFGSVLAGYNIVGFDNLILYHEFVRAGIDWQWRNHKIIDGLTIFRRQFPRDLSAAYKHYTGKTLENAHAADADVYASFHVITQQLEVHELPEDLTLYSYDDQMPIDIDRKFTMNDKGEIIFTFGKHRGLPAKDYKDFLNWMLRADFSGDTKAIAKQILSEA